MTIRRCDVRGRLRCQLVAADVRARLSRAWRDHRADADSALSGRPLARRATAIAPARRAAAVLPGSDERAGFAQLRLLCRQPLRIVFGAAHERDDRKVAPVPRAGRLRLRDGRRQRAGRIVVLAVAEHDVEHDRRGRRVARLLRDALDARARVDHRMRPADRELVVAEVDRRVPVPRARRPEPRPRRPARSMHAQPETAPEELRLGAERAAGIQAAHMALAGASGALRRRGALPVRGCARRRRSARPSSERDRRRRGVVERRDRTTCSGSALAPQASAPRNSTTHGLPIAAACSRTCRATAGAGGFETMPMTRVAGSAASRSIAWRMVAAADLGGDVAAAGADRVRMPWPSAWIWHVTSCRPVPDAPTRLIAPSRTTFAKPSGMPRRIAVPQSGPITSRPLSRASALMRALLLERHVVAEQEDVQALAQRLHRLGRRVRRRAPRSAPARRSGTRARAIAMRPRHGRLRPCRSPRCCARLRAGAMHSIARCVERLGRFGLDDDHQVAGPRRIERRAEQIRLAQGSPCSPACPSAASRGARRRAASTACAMRISATESL